MRGMPQKTIAKTICLSIETIARVLNVIRADLKAMFTRETSHLDAPKTLGEIAVQLDIAPLLMQKLDGFEQTAEYLLLATLNP
jgi:hypothetical protein